MDNIKAGQQQVAIISNAPKHKQLLAKLEEGYTVHSHIFTNGSYLFIMNIPGKLKTMATNKAKKEASAK